MPRPPARDLKVGSTLPIGFIPTTKRRARHFIRSQKLAINPARYALGGVKVMGGFHQSSPIWAGHMLWVINPLNRMLYRGKSCIWRPYSPNTFPKIGPITRVATGIINTPKARPNTPSIAAVAVHSMMPCHASGTICPTA